MKTAEIEVGAEYAIGSPSDITRHYHSIERGLVLELGVDRRVYTGSRSFGGKLKTDGILVSMPDNNARPERVVAPINVLMPWAVFAEQRAAAESAREERKRRAEARTQTLRNEIDDHLGSYMTTEHRLFIDRLPPDRLEQIASLVEAAYLFGTSAP